MLRLILSILPNLALGISGLLARAFDSKGFLAGLLCGSLVTYAFGWGGFLLVLVLVAAGSLTTKLGFSRKVARGIEEPGGGTRTWKSALGNLGIPALAAAASAVRPAWFLRIFLVGSMAAACCDTVASETGKALAKTCLTLHDLKLKDAGTAGGISLAGTLWGVSAALGMGLVGFAFNLVGGDAVGLVAAAALGATLLESLLKSGAGLHSTHVANLVNSFAGGLTGVILVGCLKRI